MKNKPHKLWMTTAKKIKDLKKNWPVLSYEQIAEQIIELEALKVGNGSIQREIQELHFVYQYPICLDMKFFKNQIYRMANKILKSESMLPFSKELNQVQQQEIMRQACKAA